MKRKNILFYLALFSAFLLSSCDVEGPFDAKLDAPFVYIVDANGLGKSEVWALAEGLTTDYYIKLSSGTRDEELTVRFEIVPGNGLREGVDYTILSPSSDQVVFTPGLYDRSVRIRWIPHAIDPSKDNTLTISLTEVSDQKVFVGFPGPTQKNANYVITKVEQ